MAQSTDTIIVVGVDFGASGDDAILQTLTLAARGLTTMIHAVHVLDPSDVIDDPEQPALLTEEEVLRRAPSLMRERFEKLSRFFDLPFAPAQMQAHARIGKACETLAQVAVDHDADLIVVGTHGRKGIERLMLGSVAEKLVRVARCPVLVARAKNYSGCEKTALPDAPYKPGEAPKYREHHDVPAHIKTERDSWHPADNGPTGIRIV